MSDNGDTVTPSSAMRQIVDWSESLPLSDWQRDALRRLYGTCPLSSQDEEELLAICKQQHSLLDEGETASAAVPLTKDDVPAEDAASSSVTIKRVSDVNYVNALADNQQVSFQENGITIVFGNNASGKSGYARILKTVCRARSGEDILHNIYESKPTEPASAKLLYSIGGSSQPAFEWKGGDSSADALSHVSVFDSKCAPIHVDEENEAAFIPLPLHILKELSDICRRFKPKFQKMSSTLSAQIPVGLRDLKCSPKSKAGAFLHGLKPTSSIDEAKQLAEVSIEEQARIEELKTTLQADPEKAISSEQSKKQRVDAVIDRVIDQLKGLDADAAQSYRTTLDAAHSKAQAADVAATTAFQNEPLDGVGSETWKALWEAARKYSESHAYPDQPFPMTDDAACVLCQQPLGQDAVVRLGTFEEFIKKNAQQAAEEAHAEVTKTRREIESQQITSEQCALDIALVVNELGNSQLESTLRRFYRTSAVRRGRMLAMQVGVPWNELRKYGHDPTVSLREESERIAEHIKELKQATDATQRETMAEELTELEDRVFLKSILPDVTLGIARLRKLACIESAVADTDTNRITRKSTELADSLVTDAWRDRFASEVSRLDIHHLRIELQREGGAYGAAKFRVALIRNAKAKLGKVLSEGEYRCIALAAFLSELATADNKSALVFDDPVSSLDHDHREAVAKRLAEEAAAGRQIIVFTHDVFFLDLISRHAQDSNASAKFLTLGRHPDNSRSGIVEHGLPSNVAPASNLANGIRRHVEQCAVLYNSGRTVQWSEQTNSFSIQLRKCWERAVAEVVAPVVRRFAVNVDTKNVWKIAALEETDCITMRSAYKRCSELNHERCAEQNRNDPTPDEYLAEIDIITDWIQAVRQKQNDAQDNRPAV